MIYRDIEVTFKRIPNIDGATKYIWEYYFSIGDNLYGVSLQTDNAQVPKLFRMNAKESIDNLLDGEK
jgi:hypothetical protein